MPYTLNWHLPNRVVNMAIIGQISDEELDRNSTEVRDNYLEPGQKPVHILCDVQQMTGYPRNLAAIRRSIQVYTTHPNLGWLIVYGSNNPVVNFMTSTITQIMRVQFRYVATREDALATLHRVDQSLGEAIS